MAEFLRPLLDGSSEASFLVRFDGIIWHANESARSMFNIVDGSGVLVSTYLSFCATHSPRKETFRLSWENLISIGSFVDNKQGLDGVGIRPNGDRFPATINLIRVENPSFSQESAESGEMTSSEANSTSASKERFFFCVYVQDITPARLQISALEEEISRLSDMKDAIVRASGQSLIVVDEAGSILSVSSDTSDIFGYESDELMVNKNVNNILQEVDGALVLSNNRRREAKGKHRDGRIVELELGISDIFTGKSPRRHKSIMIKDVAKFNSTIEKESPSDRILQGLRGSSHILDASFDPMFCTSQTGKIFMVNKAAVDQFGWSREEFIGQNISMIVGGCHRHRHDSYMRRYVKTREKRMIGKQREIQARRKDGTSLVAELGLAEVSRPGEESIFCGFIRNITKQKVYERKISDQVKAEKKISQKLLENQNIILGILDASFHALFVINEKCIIQMVNKKSSEVFGWTKEEFIGKNINMIMPSDLASRHDEFVKRYLETGIKKMIGTQREVKAQKKDGSTFPCVLGLAETNQSGMLCGFIRDLTSEKAAQSLILEEQNLTAKIIDASFDALFVTNEKGVIQRVNRASSIVFGWSQEEFIGKNISMIMPHGHASKHDGYLERYVATGFKRMIGKEREVEAVRKDGTSFPCILGLTEVIHKGSRQFVGFIKDVTMQKSLLVAQAEREAADTLLFNILPEHIARRLKADPCHIADQYNNTTILFADIVGFTDRTSAMSPHDIVTMLNDLFSRFDYLVGLYDLNKVKTIGDCYMVTSIPSDELEHDGCSRVCRFALDLMKAVKAFNNTGPQHGHINFRVGIATGPVVAGVVGTKRFLFDMWGDAVNVAARMEQSGVPGQIQVTKEVVENAGSDFYFEFRGALSIKGKGQMDVYLLKSAKDLSGRKSAHEVWANFSPKVRSNSTLL